MLKPHGYNFYHVLVLVILFSEYYGQFMDFLVLRNIGSFYLPIKNGHKILYFVIDQEADVTGFISHTNTYR